MTNHAHGTAALAQALQAGAGQEPQPGARYRVRYTCLDCGSTWVSAQTSQTIAGARNHALVERRRYVGDAISIRIEGPL